MGKGAARSKLQSFNTMDSTLYLLAGRGSFAYYVGEEQVMVINFSFGHELPSLSSIFRNMHDYLLDHIVIRTIWQLHNYTV